MSELPQPTDKTLEHSEESYASFQSEPEFGKQVSHQLLKRSDTYEEFDTTFASAPTELPKIYQIYLSNQNKINQLTDKIDHLNQTIMVSNMLAADQKNQAIEEYIDIDETSSYFEQVEQTYYQREKELNRLRKHYEEIRVSNIEAHMMTDKAMRKAFEEHFSETKLILDTVVTHTEVAVLCRQSHRKKRKTNTKKIKKLDKETIAEEKLCRSQSEESEEKNVHPLEHKPVDKYLIRRVRIDRLLPAKEEEDPTDTMTLSENELAAIGVIPAIAIPADVKELSLLCFDQAADRYIVASRDTIYHFHSPDPEKYEIDSIEGLAIVSISCEQNLMYVGSNDGVFRVYRRLNPHSKFKITKVLYCQPSTSEGTPLVTHFSVGKNQSEEDVILFVCGDNKLHEFNMVTFMSHLLAELPEKIITLTGNMIVTDNAIYYNYYVGGKVVIRADPKLQQIKDEKQKDNSKCRCIGITKLMALKSGVVVFDESNGNLSADLF